MVELLTGPHPCGISHVGRNMTRSSDIAPPGSGKPVGYNTLPDAKDCYVVASGAYIDSPSDDLVGHRVACIVDGDVEVAVKSVRHSLLVSSSRTSVAALGLPSLSGVSVQAADLVTPW